MKDGIIKIDTERGELLGFTSDKFTQNSYLWKEKDYIIISIITSKKEGKGNLSKLFKSIEEKGYKIQVPTPSTRMRSILIKKGFKGYSLDTEMGNIQIYRK